MEEHSNVKGSIRWLKRSVELFPLFWLVDLFFSGQNNSDVAQRGGEGRQSWLLKISTRCSEILFTHKHPSKACCFSGAGLGARKHEYEWDMVCPQELMVSLAGSGIALPSPINSRIHLCIYSLDSMCVRPCAGHQRCSDEEDGPRLC